MRVEDVKVTIVGLEAEDPRRAARVEACRALLRDLTSRECVVEAQGSLLGLDMEHTTWLRVRVAISPSLRWMVIGPGPGGTEELSAIGEVLSLPLALPPDGVMLLHDNERERVIATVNGSGDTVSLRPDRRACS